MYFLDQIQAVYLMYILVLTTVLILGIHVVYFYTLRANAAIDTWLSSVYRFQVAYSFNGLYART